MREEHALVVRINDGSGGGVKVSILWEGRRGHFGWDALGIHFPLYSRSHWHGCFIAFVVVVVILVTDVSLCAARRAGGPSR